MEVPAEGQAVKRQTFTFSRADQIAQGDGTKVAISYGAICPVGSEPALELYLQLTQIEDAFKNLKEICASAHLHHQEERIEAHIFVAFLGYCLHVTLRKKLQPWLRTDAAGGSGKFAAMEMLDVHFPTADGRKLILRRYTKPEKDQAILLQQLKLELPPQAPPQITAAKKLILP